MRRRWNRALLTGIPAILSFAFLPQSARAQNPQPVPQATEPLRVASELVKISTSVADSQGQYVGGLPQSDFRVRVDGAEVPIRFFTPAEEPARIVVLVETSPAVYLIQGQHIAAAYALLEGLSPQDQVALFTYDSAARGVLNFTADKNLLAQALGSIQYTLGSGQLNFYGSLAQVLQWMSPLEGKRAAVLLTTGLDASPPAFWDMLVQKMRTSDTVIYPVALGGDLRDYSGKKKAEKKKKKGEESGNASSDSIGALSFAKANEALRSIASETGGRAYFPESAADFVPAYREIASALRHQYLLGVEPLHDGKFHTISVELVREAPQPEKKGKNAPPAFTVYARSGYLAPAP